MLDEFDYSMRLSEKREESTDIKSKNPDLKVMRFLSTQNVLDRNSTLMNEESSDASPDRFCNDLLNIKEGET